MPLPSALGPGCVGTRVVVRRLLPGEVGPSGGPAMTDILGVMESWGHGVTELRTAAGELVTVPIGEIVSGKPVPPRASVLSRLAADEVERRAMASWPPLEQVPLGDWVLRAAGGFSARANSVLAVGETPPDALDAVRAFYAARGLPPWAQVVVGSPAALWFAEQGWVPARPGEADSLFQVASVARARRAAAGDRPSARPVFSPHVTDAWLAPDPPACAAPAARAVLEGPDDVGFLSLVDEPAGALLGRGRVVVSGHGADVWAGITDIWVAPEQRGRGLGAAVLAELLGWAAERGAGTAYLQTRGDNPAALALYERLGFVTHHAYRYLTAPD